MDNVTHTLFAVTLARTPLGRAGRGTTAALILASNAPDIDFISVMHGGLGSYLQWHRGPTHGLLGVVGLGLVTASLVRLARPLWPSADRDERHASFAMLAAVSMLGVMLHVLMDLPTSYGTRLLSPFDWHWFAADWLPIVDVYLLIALVAGLLFGQVSPEARRRNAAIVLVLMAANYGVRGFAHRQALNLAPRLFGPTLPQPCDPEPAEAAIDSWPRAAASRVRAPGARRCLIEVAAMPTFLSPFQWRVIAQLSNAYEIQDVNLLDARVRAKPGPGEAPWRKTLRYPNVWTAAVDKAATTPAAQIFLGFSRFPAARAFLDPAGVATVRWLDMRFVRGPVGRSDDSAGAFVVTVRIGADGQLEDRLGS